MSRLEEASVPLIGCLMQDIALSLDESQQQTMAAWAIKTAMVMDASRRRALFYTRTECQQLRLSLAVPLHTMVWLGRYSGANNLAIYGTHLWKGGKPDDPRAIHGYANTIFVGYLAIQVLTLRPPQQDGDRAVTIQPRSGPWGSLLVKVWPSEKVVRWPPKSSFTDRDPFPFPALVKRWSIGVSTD
jgi:hypothetical protein